MRLGPTNLFVYRQEQPRCLQFAFEVWDKFHRPTNQACPTHGSAWLCPAPSQWLLLSERSSWLHTHYSATTSLKQYSLLRVAQASQKLDAHAVNNKTIASWLHNFFGCLWPSTGSGRGLQGGPCEKRPAYWLFLDFSYFPGVLEGFTKCEHYGWQHSKEQPRAPGYIFTSKYLHAQLTSQPSPKLTLCLTRFLA